VGDLARANLMAMESAVAGEGINICSGVETSQRQTVELVARACGSNLQTQTRASSMSARLPSTGRQAYSREKAKRLLGWEPEVSIEEGVRRVLGWVDQQKSAKP
jgi:UDP-glucose 4-epimerase